MSLIPILSFLPLVMHSILQCVNYKLQLVQFLHYQTSEDGPR